MKSKLYRKHRATQGRTKTAKNRAIRKTVTPKRTKIVWGERGSRREREELDLVADMDILLSLLAGRPGSLL